MKAVKPRNWQDWLDLCIGVGLAAIGTVELTVGARFRYAQGGPAVALCLLTTVPLMVRRRAPVPVAALILLGFLLQVLLHQAAPAVSFFAALINVYSVASLLPESIAVAAAVFTVAVSTPHLYDNGPHPDSGDLVFTYLPVLVALGVGIAQHRRILRIGSLQTEVSAAEQLAEERARLAIAEERARIARELHDVVAHRMSVITMQAAAARRVVDNQPRVALDALSTIEDQSREALVEMRRLLDVMRLHGGDGPELVPQPGLAELEHLAVQVRAAGIPLEVEVRGEPRALSAGLDLSAYRIIQEALTNVIKHAAGARTQVVVSYGRDRLELEVLSRGDSRVGLGLASGGHGLVGMRERAALFGGRVKAGPEQGGYRVHALLPFDSSPVAG